MSFSYQQLFSFISLAIVMSITPGPNNILVLFSSVKFGIKATFPQILGASLGSALMLFFVGIGLHQILLDNPMLLLIMKYLGVSYILYLAWKIFTDKSLINQDIENKPMSLPNAILFQWINPKAWIMSGIAVTTCLPKSFQFIDISFYSILFILISFPCVWIWGGFGIFLIKYMKNIRFVRAFNSCCTILLIVSACLMIL